MGRCPSLTKGSAKMTVAEELLNRNKCRYRLAGVLVAVDGRQGVQSVTSCFWDQTNNLVVVLADGNKVPASRCHLRSRWPVACCPPASENEWNS
jgi:hypothetical protein